MPSNLLSGLGQLLQAGTSLFETDTADKRKDLSFNAEDEEISEDIFQTNTEDQAVGTLLEKDSGVFTTLKSIGKTLEDSGDFLAGLKKGRNDETRKKRDKQLATLLMEQMEQIQLLAAENAAKAQKIDFALGKSFGAGD